MIYEYQCKDCTEVFEQNFSMGEAKEYTKCECGGEAKRFFGSMSFVLAGGGFPSRDARFNKEMTERNEKAGKRMRKEHDPPPKLIDQR
jgi:putative FmdB family regulatory protein